MLILRSGYDEVCLLSGNAKCGSTSTISDKAEPNITSSNAKDATSSVNLKPTANLKATPAET